jgi:hypothetical protein
MNEADEELAEEKQAEASVATPQIRRREIDQDTSANEIASALNWLAATRT